MLDSLGLLVFWIVCDYWCFEQFVMVAFLDNYVMFVMVAFLDNIVMESNCK